MANLSREEWARAAAFVQERDRRAFVIRRTLLRRVLAARLGRDPTAIAFDATPDGKPRALPGTRSTAVQFSVSASAGVAVCALAPHDIGVDIERIRHDVDWAPTVRRFFSAGEQTAIATGGTDAFFAAWTLKEALIKARGGSVARDLKAVDVTQALATGRMVTAGFELRLVDIDDEHAAAVAVRCRDPSVRIHETSV